MMEKIHILCTPDESFAPYCGIMLTSVFENNPNTDAYVIVGKQLREKTMKKFKSLESSYNTQIKFITIDDKLLENIPLTSSIWPISAYYRLYATELLPRDIDRILYLDCDMIVDGSLRELWNTDLTDRSVAVATDCGMKIIDPEYAIRLILPIDNDYFNAGMMLINLDYWRKNKLLLRFLEFIENHSDSIKYADQDVLNVVLYDSKIHVPIRWNMMTNLYHNYFFNKYEVSLQKEILNLTPTIIHYAGNFLPRPWMYDYYLYPFAELWDDYKRKSPWRWMSCYTSHHFLRKFIKRQILWPLGIAFNVPNTLHEITNGINKEFMR